MHSYQSGAESLESPTNVVGESVEPTAVASLEEATTASQFVWTRPEEVISFLGIDEHKFRNSDVEARKSILSAARRSMQRKFHVDKAGDSVPHLKASSVINRVVDECLTDESFLRHQLRTPAAPQVSHSTPTTFTPVFSQTAASPDNRIPPFIFDRADNALVFELN